MATHSDSRGLPRPLIWALVAASVAAATLALHTGWLRSGTYNDACVPSARTNSLLLWTSVLSSVAVGLNSAALLSLKVRGDASVKRWALAFVTWALVVTASAAAIVGGGLCFTLPTP